MKNNFLFLISIKFKCCKTILMLTIHNVWRLLFLGHVVGRSKTYGTHGSVSIGFVKKWKCWRTWVDQMGPNAWSILYGLRAFNSHTLYSKYHHFILIVMNNILFLKKVDAFRKNYYVTKIFLDTLHMDHFTWFRSWVDQRESYKYFEKNTNR